tara:strand:- start:34848 stop:35330 length:483 start_codon:yes stop_codon:yes gene_type:complete
MNYSDKLDVIARDDVVVLRKKDKEYGGSWLKRGGVGAFMMMCRKWDRLETAMERVFAPMSPSGDGGFLPGREIPKYDIIERGIADPREEGILDDIGDLRRYLLLVEAEIRVRLDAKRGRENQLPPKVRVTIDKWDIEADATPPSFGQQKREESLRRDDEV